jgi:hypothetical protein
MKYIIMADGCAKRWNNYKNIPKHLIEIGGEPIIARTVRLLKENGVEDITITSHDPRYNFATRYEPIGNEYEIDKFNKELLEENTAYIYGDVFFSEEAIKTIVNTPTEDFMFFGRHSASLEKTGKTWEEIFAIKVKDTQYFLKSVDFIRCGIIDGSVWRGGAWELYRHMVGLDLKDNSLNGHFTTIDDETDDFDFPEDLERWLEINEVKYNNTNI